MKRRKTTCILSRIIDGCVCPDCGSRRLIEHIFVCSMGYERCQCPPGKHVLECHDCESVFTPFDNSGAFEVVDLSAITREESFQNSSEKN